VYVVNTFVGNGDVAPLIFNLAAGWNGLVSCAGRFTSEKEPEVPIQQEAGWSQSRSGRFGKEINLLPHLGSEPRLFAH